jgi:hypothetical protein
MPADAPDPAVRQAREVVGLYGDPMATWGIALELGLEHRLDRERMGDRIRRLVTMYPHLGLTPRVEQVADVDWQQRRAALAGVPYGDREPLVRIAVDERGGRLLVAGHHGVCDGLGLLAIADRVGHLGLVSRARGIGERQASVPFFRSSVRRVHDALRHPPARFRSVALGAGRGENLDAVRLAPLQKGTADFCHALGATFADWNDLSLDDEVPLLLVLGASRRSGGLEPDRQTAFLRFAVDARWDLSVLRGHFRDLEPEPSFPETSAGGMGPLVTRLLRRRLGSTAQVSNLGVVGGHGVKSVAMFPSLNGPRAVSFGLATTAGSTTVTIRTRGEEFSASDTALILERLARRFAGQAPDGQ